MAIFGGMPLRPLPLEELPGTLGRMRLRLPIMTPSELLNTCDRCCFFQVFCSQKNRQKIGVFDSMEGEIKQKLDHNIVFC
jgi:hypothetical protein